MKNDINNNSLSLFFEKHNCSNTSLLNQNIQTSANNSFNNSGLFALDATNASTNGIFHNEYRRKVSTSFTEAAEDSPNLTPFLFPEFYDGLRDLDLSALSSNSNRANPIDPTGIYVDPDTSWFKRYLAEQEVVNSRIPVEYFTSNTKNVYRDLDDVYDQNNNRTSTPNPDDGFAGMNRENGVHPYDVLGIDPIENHTGTNRTGTDNDKDWEIIGKF